MEAVCVGKKEKSQIEALGRPAPIRAHHLFSIAALELNAGPVGCGAGGGSGRGERE